MIPSEGADLDKDSMRWEFLLKHESLPHLMLELKHMGEEVLY